MVYILGKVPDGEQTERYSKTFDARSAINAQHTKPINTLVMVRANPPSRKKNDHTPYMQNLQKPLM